MLNKFLEWLKGICSKVIYCGRLKAGKKYRTCKICNMNIHKRAHIDIGRSCRISGNTILSSFKKLRIGDHVSINRNCMIIAHESIAIGSNTSIGPNVLIYDHDHKFGANGKEIGFNTSPVEIGDNVWLGGALSYVEQQ